MKNESQINLFEWKPLRRFHDVVTHPSPKKRRDAPKLDPSLTTCKGECV